jgi:GNAT superfamily N-acetyltransferase
LSSIISCFELIIDPLNKDQELSSFTCSDSDLNEFLKYDASNDQKFMINRTSLCFWKNELVGYITLVTDTIGTKEVIISDEIRCKYNKYPGIKIARLAVDSKFERRGIGTCLLYAAIGKALSISDSVGCRYVLVDSKKESIGFYERHGFKIAVKNKKDNYTPMYFDLYPVLLEINSSVPGEE